jgi:general secretion pathway protein B
MSLILEALRKSEAERRRGRMPDLHAELPPLAAPRAAPAPAWRWIAGSGVLVALALAVWLAAGMRTRAATTQQDVSTPLAAPIAHASSALPPVTHLQPRPTPAPARTTMPAPSTIATAPTKDTAAWPEPLRPLPPAPAAAPTIAPAAPMPNIASAPRTLPPPPSATSSSAGGVLTLADLGPADRKALPPLKMSMHMWNDDASQRFVILDGNRLGEGDRIGDAIVTSITRDGVLLDWNGRTLKVTLR